MGYYDIEPVGGTTLEDDYQLLALGLSAGGLSQHRPLQERRHYRGAYQGHRPALHECATCCHLQLQTRPALADTIVRTRAGQRSCAVRGCFLSIFPGCDRRGTQDLWPGLTT